GVAKSAASNRHDHVGVGALTRPAERSSAIKEDHMTPVETTTLTSASFEELVKEILIRLDEDPVREGLVRTPHRVHRAFEFLTRGYKEDPEAILTNALFTASSHEIVIGIDLA